MANAGPHAKWGGPGCTRARAKRLGSCRLRQLRGFSFFFGQQRQQRLALSVVGRGLKSLLEVLDVLVVNKAFDGGHHAPFLSGAQH